MKMSLRRKLSISYISVVAIAVLLISLLTNVIIEKQFTKYVSQNQVHMSDSIVDSIKKQYRGSGNWSVDVIENIGVDALEQGMLVSLKDTSGKRIWDARVYNNGMCNQMLAHMSSNMSSRYPNNNGKYQEKSYQIFDKTKLIGTVYIGYYGPVYFTDNDLIFIDTFNKITLTVGILALVFAFIISLLMSRRISKPVTMVIDKAHRITKGNYKQMETVKSDIKEIIDLSETMNHLSETLEQQELLRKRLTADVAHELRTPVATLQSHLEAMIDGIWEPDTQRLKSCHEETTRIGRMIGDLEKLSKYESEKMVLKKEHFDLKELTQSILLNFQSAFDKKGIIIEFEGANADIYADKDKISQVVVNLVSNALKYSNEKGKVAINVSQNKGMAVLQISDSGIGISKEDLPFIFERFYRADQSRSRMTGGAGIGLTITKSIVDSHNGEIDVASELGIGTQVSVYLPMA